LAAAVGEVVALPERGFEHGLLVTALDLLADRLEEDAYGHVDGPPVVRYVAVAVPVGALAPFPLACPFRCEDPLARPIWSASTMFGLKTSKSILRMSSSVHMWSSSRCGCATSVLPSARRKPRP